MNVLVACEESQAVCKAFRERGHTAWSCDILPCSGGHPEWHIQGDVLPFINGNCTFTTMDGITHTHTGPWDLLIAHPPCTYLSNVSTRAFSLRCTEADKVVDRWKERAIAAVFFMRFIFASALRIAVENPVGFMNTAYRRPDQIIHPYMFAESVNDTENYHTKRTCLWLKGLEPLKPNDIPAPNLREIYGIYPSGKTPCWEDVVSGRERAKIRSKTFPGIAAAMAEQWGESEGEYDTPESNPTQMP